MREIKNGVIVIMCFEHKRKMSVVILGENSEGRSSSPSMHVVSFGRFLLFWWWLLLLLMIPFLLLWRASEIAEPQVRFLYFGYFVVIGPLSFALCSLCAILFQRISLPIVQRKPTLVEKFTWYSREKMRMPYRQHSGGKRLLDSARRSFKHITDNV